MNRQEQQTLTTHSLCGSQKVLRSLFLPSFDLEKRGEDVNAHKQISPVTGSIPQSLS